MGGLRSKSRVAQKKSGYTAILSIPHGIPSHDTFGDVFSRIEPEAFRACFIAWTASIAEITESDVIAIDGRFCVDQKMGCWDVKHLIWLVLGQAVRGIGAGLGKNRRLLE